MAKFCGMCGYDLNNECEFCPNCGNNIKKESAPPACESNDEQKITSRKTKSKKKWVIISVVAIVVALVIGVATFFVINLLNKSNDEQGIQIAKVGGVSVYDYEYNMYLDKFVYKMREDAVEAGTLKEDATTEEITAFWTDERKQEVADKAMEEVCKWKAEYVLAKEKGFELTSKETNSLRENLNYQVQSVYQQYSVYYTYEEFVQMYVGMNMDQYVKVYIQDETITRYKDSLKNEYSATDAELKESYDKAPDDYRFITLRVFGLAKPEKPEEVKLPDFMKNEDGSEKEVKESDLTDTQKTEYKAYKEYKTKLAIYNYDIKEVKDRLDDMSKQLNETGKYNENDETDETDESSTSTANDLYKDATLADIVRNEGKMFTDTAGVKEINAVTSSGYDTLDEYALTMQWADDACTKIQSEQKDKDGNDIVADADGETVDKITYTKYVVLEDDDYIYVVRCEGIEDFANSTESSEGVADSVKDNVRKELYEEKACLEISNQISGDPETYEVTDVDQQAIDDVVSEHRW